MMAAHKHLHELLTQDQEPFHLHDYIADRRCQLSKPSPSSLNPNRKSKSKPTLHLNKHKPSTNLCSHACFFSFHDSPDVRKSPLFQFQSPAKSPNKVLLHVPAKTATMLLDAAIRIQKQSIKTAKAETKNSGFGVFGSFLKRLKVRSSKTKKFEIGVNPVSDNSSNISRASSTQKTALAEIDGNRSAYENGLSSCSCNISSRLSSAGWSESNEEKSLDLETSCSSRSEEDLEQVEEENGQFGSCDKCFCASPLSPFRFTLLQSPSPGRGTPDFLSPVTSPSRHFNQDKENHEVEILEKEKVEEEEEKEQCSPVSVLDPLFEDDNEEQEGEDEDEDGEYDDYDQECSYAHVQRTKNQLLAKLRRFERLADLDPVELEKKMSEQESDEEEEDEYATEEETSDYDNESHLCLDTSNDLVREVFNNLTLLDHSKIPSHVKRLVSDLVNEENTNGDGKSEGLTKRVCKRLDSWKEVESNTIDMMVGKDFEREVVGWKAYNKDHIKECGMEIEVAIFGLLVEEVAEELISMVGGNGNLD